MRELKPKRWYAALALALSMAAAYAYADCDWWLCSYDAGAEMWHCTYVGSGPCPGD